MSFLEDLSDSFDDYSGLMMAGGMLQRQSMVSAQQQGAAAAQGMLQLQREQAELQQQQQEEAMQMMHAEQQRRQQMEVAARECRYLISYAQQILHESPTCSFTHGTAGIVGQMVDIRLGGLDLGVHDLQVHQSNQGKIRQATGGGTGINEAADLLKTLTNGLRKINDLIQAWVGQRDQLCANFYQNQRHPLWVGYCISEESTLRDWMPPGHHRSSIPESIKREYSTLAIPDDISGLLHHRVSAMMDRLMPNLEKLVSSQPIKRIKSIFESTGGLMVWTDDLTHLDEPVDHSLAQSVGNSALALSRPPNVIHFKVAKPILLFLNLAEDVDSGDIQLDAVQHDRVRGVYQSFMTALDHCDRALGQMDDRLLELLCLLSGDLQKNVKASLTILKHRSKNEKAEYRAAFNEIKVGNISRAAGMIDHLASQNNHKAAKAITDAISKVRAPLEKMRALESEVLKEYDRLNTPMRRAWGPGFGKVYQTLEARLRSLNTIVRQSPYPASSELANEVDEVIQSVTPACELAELCFTWKKAKLTLSDLVKKMKPKSDEPGSIYINALCAMAAADGDFCTAEQRMLEDRIRHAPINLSAASIKNVIGFWCDKARGGSVLEMIAQSIVDTQNLRKHKTIAQAMITDLYEIAKADGNASKSEGVVYKAIVAQLKAGTP